MDKKVLIVQITRTSSGLSVSCTKQNYKSQNLQLQHKDKKLLSLSVMNLLMFSVQNRAEDIESESDSKEKQDDLVQEDSLLQFLKSKSLFLSPV